MRIISIGVALFLSFLFLSFPFFSFLSFSLQGTRCEQLDVMYVNYKVLYVNIVRYYTSLLT